MNTPPGRPPGEALQASFKFAKAPDRFATIDAASANQAAIDFLKRVGDWPVATACLIGPPRSGRSTLARAWAHSQGGLCLTPQTLLGQAEPLGGSERALAVDPADEGLPETVLLGLINQAGERGGRLLLTASAPPLAWPVESRDLASRLVSLPLAEIESPDRETVGIRLYSLLKRHFEAPPMDVVRYLEQRLQRTYEDIEACAMRLAGAVGSGQALTVLLASRILAEMYGPEDTSDG
ncbi:MAG: hypothetical protein AAF486_04645 [Pseudomonadota bacterium]